MRGSSLHVTPQVWCVTVFDHGTLRWKAHWCRLHLCRPRRQRVDVRSLSSYLLGPEARTYHVRATASAVNSAPRKACRQG